MVNFMNLVGCRAVTLYGINDEYSISDGNGQFLHRVKQKLGLLNPWKLNWVQSILLSNPETELSLKDIGAWIESRNKREFFSFFLSY